MSTDLNKMFSRIHNNYDLMNHVLSLNVDKEWRRKAAEMAMLNKKEYSVLDVATGTGDLAIEVSRMASSMNKSISIHGSDFNNDMLEVASEKAKELGIKNIRFEYSNALKLRNKSSQFDVLITGFALRSLAYSKGGWKNLEDFARESNRVLKKNGRLILLDMAMPDPGYQREFFRVYGFVMKGLGYFVDREAYAWLVDTIKTFDKKRLAAIVERSGFRNVKIMNLKSGVAFIISAEKA